jgi:uncharacterized membrane protein
MLFLALAGLADSVYLSYTAFTHTALSCSITGIAALDGCNVVAQSVYSHFLGIPLGVFGVLFYIFILAAILWASVSTFIWAHRFLLTCTTVGFFMSIGFIALQAFVIHAVCIYCIASFVIALLLWVLNLSARASHLPIVPTSI